MTNEARLTNMQRNPFSTDSFRLQYCRRLIEPVNMRLNMKVFPKLQAMVLLALVFLYSGSRVQAQLFGVGASSSSGSIATNMTVTYFITITNFNSVQAMNGVFVTNQFSSGVPVQSVVITNSYGNAVNTITSSNIIINIPSIVLNFPADMAITVQLTNSGSFTNFITIIDNITNLFATNFVTQTTNIAPTETDLGVSVIGPGPDVYVRDWITYKVTVTNSGPNAASGVVLTNVFQPSVVRSIDPPNRFTNGTAILHLGTLASQAGTNFTFTVQPTNSVTTNLSFTASIGSTASDPNSTNNVVTVTNVASTFLTNSMVAFTNAPTQTFNPQNGLMEQRIVLSNASPDAVNSARVIVTGLGSSNRLFNAAGTNDGNAFVVHGAPLGPDESIGLLLQFKVPSHQPFALPNSNLLARATLAADLTPPSFAPGAQVNQSRMINVNSTMYVEFPSTNGRSYTIVYSDDISFTNSRLVRPPIVAPANWTYFIDYGPPATISAPVNSSSRFYKIYLNP
jgi:hypothetical protein